MEEKNNDTKRPIIVVPDGVAELGLEDSVFSPHLAEFDVQKTAESEDLYPAIAQGFPVSGFKEIYKKDKFR